MFAAWVSDNINISPPGSSGTRVGGFQNLRYLLPRRHLAGRTEGRRTGAPTAVVAAARRVSVAREDAPPSHLAPPLRSTCEQEWCSRRRERGLAHRAPCPRSSSLSSLQSAERASSIHIFKKDKCSRAAGLRSV